VRIVCQDGREVARGLVAYDSVDAQKIAGRKSSDIEALLGYAGRNAMVHRDDLALTSVSAVATAGKRDGFGGLDGTS
jgi:glutamate 5-kinase